MMLLDRVGRECRCARIGFNNEKLVMTAPATPKERLNEFAQASSMLFVRSERCRLAHLSRNVSCHARQQ